VHPNTANKDPHVDMTVNKAMKLSIVIPCYNEKNTIADIIHAAHSSPGT
jgi:cellulose synthase/poly-beta-1,6-N-acetylglucosamine synthase-like glycosyltransferase